MLHNDISSKLRNDLESRAIVTGSIGSAKALEGMVSPQIQLWAPVITSKLEHRVPGISRAFGLA